MWIASSTRSTAAPGGCGMPRSLRNPSKRRRSSARSIVSNDEPMIGERGVVQRAGEVDRGLAAELHDDRRHLATTLGAVAGLVFEDVAHRLLVERLEVEAVAGVEVGRDRLRVGVRHDRLVTGAFERPRRMHRAVVELDALADADRAAADDERLLAGLGDGLVLLLVRAVEVRRRRVELGGARVDHLVHRADIPLVAQRAHLVGQPVAERADLLVGERHALGGAQQVRRQVLGQQPLLHRR